MKKSIETLTPAVIKRYRVKPQEKIDLKRRDPGDSAIPDLKKKDEKRLIEGLNKKLAKLQNLLYAEHKHKVLIVLQGMDTSGKDSTIAHVFRGVNPQGVRVASFKVPTQQELDHDFLWRIHRQVPSKGEMVIFNRSHYEDVVAVRVHGLVEPAVWKARYDEINAFERMLAEEGALILKFFLFIDKDEQKKRLEERLDDPQKNWKFSSNDVKERARWPHYLKAYEDALNLTSTKWAPWFVVPSNRKWYRNLAVSLIIIEALTRLNMRYPKAEAGLQSIRII